MQTLIISAGEAGQRFDKFLGKYFRDASAGFLYKMLRKKNITLNGRKAAGSEILKEADEIAVFMSDGMPAGIFPFRTCCSNACRICAAPGISVSYV